MMSIREFNKDVVEKKLDIAHGDLVYLRGDLGLQAGVGDLGFRAGIGVVISTERWSFDVFDLPFATQERCFFMDSGSAPVLVGGVLVYWFGIEKEMWMEDQDLSPL